MNKENSLNENRIADVTDNQLTLTPILNSTPAIKNRQSKIKNSSWWFNQMRRLVDNATDWEAALWCLSAGQYLVVECKSEVDLNRAEINKDESGQMNNACAWFEKYYKGAKAT